jgi:hypothetical protein
LWRNTGSPGADPRVEKLTVSLPGMKFDEPVLVDMVSGRVYTVDEKLVERSDKGVSFTGVPVYDSVVVLADRSAIAHVLDKKKAPAE